MDKNVKQALRKTKERMEKQIMDNELKTWKKAKGVIYCPVNGWDCPYFDANGCCMMWPDTDPILECDDFAAVWDYGDDYIVEPEI